VNGAGGAVSDDTPTGQVAGKARDRVQPMGMATLPPWRPRVVGKPVYRGVSWALSRVAAGADHARPCPSP
jgi:hypothetical protein